MRERATTLLEIIREANRSRVTIPSTVIAIIARQMGITETELYEIGEILKADIRESSAMHPDFPALNERLRRTSAENPRGD